MNILIVAPSWIGDTVAAHPLFMRIRKLFPEACIDAFAPPWVAAVLCAMPEINGRIIENRFGHGQLNLTGRWKLARELHKHAYDMAFVLPNSLKSALIPFFAGIPKRIGFTGESRYGLINVRHNLDTQTTPLQVERYAILAEHPGHPLPRPLPDPHLTLDHESVIATLNTLGLHEVPAPVVFCPGAEFGPAKQWPAHHFAKLAQALVQKNIPVWLLGSAKDVQCGDEITQLSGGATRNLCGKTNLTQAIHLLGHARHVVTNDSGLMHVAAALGTPLTALFGSSSPGYTPPLSKKAQIVSLGLRCSPCFKRECPLGHLDCLEKITPEQILSTLEFDPPYQDTTK